GAGDAERLAVIELAPVDEIGRHRRRLGQQPIRRELAAEGPDYIHKATLASFPPLAASAGNQKETSPHFPRRGQTKIMVDPTGAKGPTCNVPNPQDIRKTRICQLSCLGHWTPGFAGVTAQIVRKTRSSQGGVAGALGAAARRRRSLMARPRPCSGTGIPASRRAPLASSRRRWAKRLAAAWVRSPAGLRLRVLRAP